MEKFNWGKVKAKIHWQELKSEVLIENSEISNKFLFQRNFFSNINKLDDAKNDRKKLFEEIKNRMDDTGVNVFDVDEFLNEKELQGSEGLRIKKKTSYLRILINQNLKKNKHSVFLRMKIPHKLEKKRNPHHRTSLNRKKMNTKIKEKLDEPEMLTTIVDKEEILEFKKNPISRFIEKGIRNISEVQRTEIHNTLFQKFQNPQSGSTKNSNLFNSNSDDSNSELDQDINTGLENGEIKEEKESVEEKEEEDISRKIHFFFLKEMIDQNEIFSYNKENDSIFYNLKSKSYFQIVCQYLLNDSALHSYFFNQEAMFTSPKTNKQETDPLGNIYLQNFHSVIPELLFRSFALIPVEKESNFQANRNANRNGGNSNGKSDMQQKKEILSFQKSILSKGLMTKSGFLKMMYLLFYFINRINFQNKPRPVPEEQLQGQQNGEEERRKRMFEAYNFFMTKNEVKEVWKNLDNLIHDILKSSKFKKYVSLGLEIPYSSVGDSYNILFKDSKLTQKITPFSLGLRYLNSRKNANNNSNLTSNLSSSSASSIISSFSRSRSRLPSQGSRSLKSGSRSLKSGSLSQFSNSIFFQDLEPNNEEKRIRGELKEKEKKRKIY